MAQNITRSVKQMIDEASAEIRTVSVEEAKAMQGRDDVTFIDIRDVRELSASGRVKGARHVPRGMLEFWIDPESPSHKEFFAEDQTFVFYCASAWRSALATKVAADMGLSPVCHIEGGFKAWQDAGGDIDPPKPK